MTDWLWNYVEPMAARMFDSACTEKQIGLDMEGEELREQETEKVTY